MTDTIENRNPRILPTMGQRIAFLRKRAGLTQAQLAEKMGLSAQAVSKWEGDLSCPDILMLPALAKLFQVSTDELLGVIPLRQEDSDFPIAPAQVDTKAQESAGSPDTEKNIPFREEEPAPENSEIHSLCLDLGAAEVEIQESDHFSLTFIGFKPDDCSSIVENGVWKIKEERFRWVTASFRFHERKAVLTVPKDFRFRSIKLKIGAGTLNGTGITAGESHLDVGAGQITLHRFYSGPTVLECGMGEIRLDGALSGRCRLQCGMGNIHAEIIPPADLGYEVDVGMGDVVIGQDHFGGMGGHYRMNTEAENFFDVDCGMGAVKVFFSTKEN